jgi:hypothetical protein
VISPAGQVLTQVPLGDSGMAILDTTADPDRQRRRLLHNVDQQTDPHVRTATLSAA